MQGDDEGDGPFLALTEEEVSRCLLALDDPQHRAILSLMLDTGLSLPEILGDDELDMRGIYIQDITPDQLKLTVYTRFVKTDRLTPREVPIGSETLIAIKQYLFDLDRTLWFRGKLFDVKERRVRQFMVELGEKIGTKKKITPIVVRRTAIIRMLKNGLKPDEVRRRMGFIRFSDDIVLSAAGYFLIQPEAYERMVRKVFIDSLIGRDSTSAFSSPSGFSGAVSPCG